MSKKRYFRTSLSSLIFQVLIIVALLSATFLAVLLTHSAINLSFKEEFERQLTVIFAVIFYLCIIPLIYLELTFLIGNIILGKDKIYTHGDIKLGKYKTQYYSEVKYEEIRRIEVIALRRDSRGKFKETFKPLPFMLIESKNGRQVLFSLKLMSTKALNHLLEELSNRCSGPAINVNQLEKEFKNYYKLY